jgi:phosphopantetheinyl transferase (holo-ACP synthase)
VTQDSSDIPVHTLNSGRRGGPVFYASLPRDAGASRGHGADSGELRHRLVAALWKHLLAAGSPLWNHCSGPDRAAFPLQVVHGPLGKPHLLVGECRGPALSFSEGGGRVWAALCADDTAVGIDVAGADEFPGEYPFHRVFQAQEFQHALELLGDDVGRAAALLWSIKEAIVKALGCGFHRVEPRDIWVHPCAEKGSEHAFSVCLSKKALDRVPMGAGPSLWGRSLPQGKTWLSIACLEGTVTS